MNRQKRTLYAVIGIIILLAAGMVYAWSVLSISIGAFFTEWSKARLSTTFTICMMCFCLGGMCGGMTAKKLNVKHSIWISGALFLAGFLIASAAQTTLVMYIGYGVLCGFASGFAYNAAMSTVSAWFPDRQGQISGILLMGFGLSSFVIGKVYQACTPSGAGVEAWRTSFRAFGIILAVIMAVCGCFFKRPEPGELEKLNISGTKKKRADDGLELSTSEMIRRPSFWIFLIWTICLGASGMALISQASGIAKEVGPQVEGGTIATVVGLISIFNAIGRVFFGNLFDRKGRKVTMLLSGAAFAASAFILVFALISHSFALIVIGFICCGFSYGGLTPSISAYVNASYGARHYAMNFSVMNLNLLVASFGSTIAGALYDAGGSYMAALFFIIGACLLSIVCTLLIRKV
jgi:OFA family oxalate/formate antiporter-like MFS transporter